MANIASAASGNWSNPSTWDGGVVPGVDDTAQVLTGHAVTINQDIEVQGLSSTGSGQFLLSGSTPRSIICSNTISLPATATVSIVFFDSSYTAEGSSITIGGTVAIGSHTDATLKGVIGFDAGASGSCTINAQTVTGRSSGSGNAYFIYSIGDTDLDITVAPPTGISISLALIMLRGTGNANVVVNCSPLQYGRFIEVGDTGAYHVTINGEIYNRSTPYPIACSSVNASFVINGNVTTTSSQHTLYFTNVSSVIVNGNITAAPTSGTGSQGGHGLYVQPPSGASFAITVNGDIRGGDAVSTGNPQPGRGVYVNGNATVSMTVNGSLYGGSLLGGSGSPGSAVTISGSSANSTLRVTGDIVAGYGPTTFRTVSGAVDRLLLLVFGESGETSYLVDTTDQAALGDLSILIAAGANIVYRCVGVHSMTGEYDLMDALTNLDSDIMPSDVRAGVTYDSDGKVGTMSVPAPSDVAYGVPVDDTTGTASLKLADAAAITGTQIASLSQ